MHRHLVPLDKAPSRCLHIHDDHIGKRRVEVPRVGEMKRMRNKTALQVRSSLAHVKGERALSSLAGGTGGTLGKRFVEIGIELAWHVELWESRSGVIYKLQSRRTVGDGLQRDCDRGG